MIKIIKITEQKDGSAIIDIEYSKEFEDEIKRTYNLKRLTKKRIQKVVIEALKHKLQTSEKK